MKKWRDKITYKGKVLIGLFLVSVLPIGVLGGYSYGVLYNAMHTRMDYVAEAEIEEINETVDGILGNIRSYYLDRIAAEPIVNMINESMGYSQYTIQVEAMKVLQGGSYLNRYIKGYSLINMKTDWVLSDRGMYYFTESDNQTELKELMKGSEYRTAYIVNASPDFIPMPHGTINISGMFFLFKLPNATPNTQCILIVNLNKNEIYDNMNKLADYEITVLDGQNRLVMGTDDELAAYIVEHAEELENKKQLKLSSQKSVSFRMLQSDNEELSYIITYDNSIINRESNRIITLALILLGMILAAAVIAYVIGNHLYKPIIQLANDVSNTIFFQKREEKDDIRRIQSGVLDLVLQNTSLEEKLVLQRKILKESLVSELLNGTIQEEKINVSLKRLDEQTFAYYYVVALHVWGESDAELDQNDLLFDLEQYLLQVWEQDIFLVPKVFGNALIFIVGEGSEKNIEDKTEKIIHEVRQYVQLKTIDKQLLGIGTSKSFQMLQYAYKARLEAMEASKISGVKSESWNYDERSFLTRYGDIVQGMDNKITYPVSQEVKIQQCVDTCQTQEAIEAVDEFITMMYEQRISIMERRYYLQRAFLGILEVLEDAGLRISEIFSENEEDMFLRFQHLYEMEDMKHFFKEKIVLPAIEVLKQSRMVNGKNIKERVLELIRKSRGDITLMECADKLNYNSNYLGRVLHCESNSSFSAYVAEIKVEYAKELLMKTEMTVADISTYLNYSNSQNFIRFFQKHVGMSPAKYRIHVRENQSE